MLSYHERTRKLPGESNNSRNNVRCTQARKTPHGLDRQHQVTWSELPVDESVRMTEDRDKWIVWPTLGLRTAKEQNRTAPYSCT